jgi:hypothetical protein
MKHRFTCIQSRWRRFLIKTVLTIMSWLNEFRRERSRHRVHWIGRRQRPQRPERAFIVLMFAIAITLLEPYEYAVWATIVGGFTALTIPFISLRYILRAHWVR